MYKLNQMRLKNKKGIQGNIRACFHSQLYRIQNGGRTLSLPQCTPRLEDGRWKKAKMQRAMLSTEGRV